MDDMLYPSYVSSKARTKVVTFNESMCMTRLGVDNANVLQPPMPWFENLMFLESLFGFVKRLTRKTEMRRKIAQSQSWSATRWTF